jgi:predicted methyltransferase
MKIKPLITFILGVSFFTLQACSGSNDQENKYFSKSEISTILEEVISHPRRELDMPRDEFRNPKETLEFFGITPGMKVGEIWPGWYTQILAPYLSKIDGTYVAILRDGQSDRIQSRNKDFMEKYGNKKDYGTVEFSKFGSKTIAPAQGNLDMLLSFRNVHNWMSQSYAKEAFSQFYESLKPGGILGIVEHRLPEEATQDPTAGSGYVQESYIKDLAMQAGFEFIADSNINSNPLDTTNHPFGVWTLKPRSYVPNEASKIPADFEAEAYERIGESDRATLKFKKPIETIK